MVKISSQSLLHLCRILGIFQNICLTTFLWSKKPLDRALRISFWTALIHLSCSHSKQFWSLFGYHGRVQLGLYWWHLGMDYFQLIHDGPMTDSNSGAVLIINACRVWSVFCTQTEHTLSFRIGYSTGRDTFRSGTTWMAQLLVLTASRCLLSNLSTMRLNCQQLVQHQNIPYNAGFLVIADYF